MSIKGLSFYAFILAIISIIIANSKCYYLIILTIIILIYLLKKYDSKSFVCFLLISLFFMFYKTNERPQLNSDTVNQEMEVVEVKEKYLIVQANNINYLVYQNENKYYVKDIVSIKGSVKQIENDLDIDVFEFASYLKNKRVFYEIESEKIELISNNKTLSSKIIDKCLINLKNSSYKMTKMLLFNDKNADIETYNNLKEISAVHLFVVSGFHISFLFNILSFIFKPFKKVSNIIALIVCFFYVYLLDFSISATRALISLILSKLFNKRFNKLDYIGIPGLLFLLIEPLYIYNYSFIMSFLLVSVITLSNKILSKKNKIVQTILLSCICFFTMIPIQLSLNYKINFISLITNIILSYIVMVIFVLCILGLIISPLNGNLFSPIYDYFNQFVFKISNLKSTLLFGNMNIFLMILYYLLLFLLLLFLEKKKYKMTFLTFFKMFLLMFCLYNRGYFLYSQQVTFLNVYQGDCAIIQDSFTNQVMLIDTGGLLNYDIASKKIMPYLNYHGIKKIDKIVISHEDYDHCGALESLKMQIEIEEIITDNTISQVNIGKIKLLNVNSYFNENSSTNDKSIVLYGNICHSNFLFTGDISSSIEKEIIANEMLNVDILKVAHHGSKTSTCEEFLNSIKPKYAIISVGKNNYYGHPSSIVLDSLEKYEIIIYRTDIDGSIRFKENIFFKLCIETAN